MDLTAGPEVYEAAARAAIAASGAPKDERSLEVMIALWMADPFLRATVDSAYGAGREDAARDVESFGESQACYECGPQTDAFAAAARGAW